MCSFCNAKGKLLNAQLRWIPFQICLIPVEFLHPQQVQIVIFLWNWKYDYLFIANLIFYP